MLGCPLQGIPDSGRGQLEKEAELGTERFLSSQSGKRGFPDYLPDPVGAEQGWEGVWKPQ